MTIDEREFNEQIELIKKVLRNSILVLKGDWENRQQHQNILQTGKYQAFIDNIEQDLRELLDSTGTALQHPIPEKVKLASGYTSDLAEEFHKPYSRESVEPASDDGLKKRLNDASEMKRLIEILMIQKDSQKVAELLDYLKEQTISISTIKKALTVFKHYYNHPDDKICVQLERFLTNLKDYDIRFNHSQVKYSADSALRFKKIKVNYTHDRLELYELEKIANLRISSNRENIILFEFCPEILLNGDIWCLGRILVS